MNLKGRNKVSPEFSMASMTDIVFLLLIFFMLTSNTVTIDALELILPKAKGKTEHKQNLAVSINKKQEFYINKQKIEEKDLEVRLRSMLGKEEKPTIILRAEESVPVEKVVYVMDVANKNKYKIILAVRPK